MERNKVYPVTFITPEGIEFCYSATEEEHIMMMARKQEQENTRIVLIEKIGNINFSLKKI